MAIKIPYMVNETVGGGQLGKMNMIPPDFRGIAKAIGATGDMATEYFTRKQMERNDTVARKVQTDFTNEALRLEAEMSQFKGKDAIGKQAEYDKKWAEFTKSYSESEEIAGNANHLKAVEFFGSKFGGDLSSTIAKHEMAQGEVYRLSVLDQQGETIQAKVGALSVGKGWSSVVASFPEMQDVAIQKSKMTGKDSSLHMMEMVTGVIQSYSRQETNPQLLLDAVNSASGYMDENVRAQVEAQAQGKLDAKIGQSFGADLFMQGMGQVDAVKTIMAKYPDNDNARSSALATYSQFKSAQNTDRAEYDRYQNELLNKWLADGGEPPAGLSEAHIKRTTGKTLGELKTEAVQDKGISAQTIYDAQSIFSTGVIAMSKAKTPLDVQKAMNLTESGLMKLNPKLAQQYAPKLAEYASRVGKPEHLDSLTKVEAQLKTVYLQLRGKEYKASSSGTNKEDKLYNRVLATVMTDPALQTADGIKQTFLDQNRLVEENYVRPDTMKFEQDPISERQTKDAVGLGVNINPQRSKGYKAFSDAKLLGENGLILPQYRMAIAKATEEYYQYSQKKTGYGQNPTPEVVVLMLKQKGIIPK